MFKWFWTLFLLGAPVAGHLTVDIEKKLKSKDS